MMWGAILISYVLFCVTCLLHLASEKTMNRNWLAGVALVIASFLGYMAGQS